MMMSVLTTALALSVADRILMLSSSAYSVVSPEACASILWKDTERADEAAEFVSDEGADAAAEDHPADPTRR